MPPTPSESAPTQLPSASVFTASELFTFADASNGLQRTSSGAMASGARTPMSCRLARRLCPDAIVVPPRMSAYSEASKALFRVFEDASPLVEGLSIDEAFLDVRGMERTAGTPVDIAVRL